jgi:hypothetical protein
VFVPPELSDVIAFCEERNNGVNAKKVYDSYAVNDWKDSNGKQISNWKQKIIQVWEKDSDKEKKKPVYSKDYSNETKHLFVDGKYDPFRVT